MAATTFPTTCFTASEFVESAGCVLFHLASERVCLIYYKRKKEWLLAKGRRNCGESHAAAAVRETAEETSYKCHLLPLDMATRAPPKEDTDVNMIDEARVLKSVTEPFMISIRDLGHGERKNMKLIWWFIAYIDEAEVVMARKPSNEPQYDVGLFDYETALQQLKFEHDREVVNKAIEIVRANAQQPK